MITRTSMNHLATRAFALEELIDTTYETAKELEELATGPGEMGNLAYRVSHLLNAASHLSGGLAHDLSDQIRECADDDTGGAA